ncbi:MAG: hypothetical protein ABI346_09660 [Candidatus Baltobacteraceae bacterium]
MSTGQDPIVVEEAGRVDELLNLLEIDPDALREAEFEQVQSILETLVGQTIASATMEERRIVVETKTGDRYFFYGFMGNRAGEET